MHVYVCDLKDFDVMCVVFDGLLGFVMLFEGDVCCDVGFGYECVGELVVLVECDVWFVYYYWFDDVRVLDFVCNVEIYCKLGYDLNELFFDLDDKFVKFKVGVMLVCKKVGLCYSMQVVLFDSCVVKGTYGLLLEVTIDALVLILSEMEVVCDCIVVVEVCDLLFELMKVFVVVIVG